MQVSHTCYVWKLVYFQYGFHSVFLAFFGTFSSIFFFYFSFFTKKIVFFLAFFWLLSSGQPVMRMQEKTRKVMKNHFSTAYCLAKNEKPFSDFLKLLDL